jgi:hypothetical protein
MSDTTTNKIAELNDLCRTAMGIAGKLFQTSGISALPLADQSAIREKVETFDAFTRDNDPHGERDFGAFDHQGQRFSGRSTTTTVRVSAPGATWEAKTRATPPKPFACSPSCSHPNTDQSRGPLRERGPFSDHPAADNRNPRCQATCVRPIATPTMPGRLARDNPVYHALRTC